MSKVLVVSLCNEKMHDLEFVLPVVDVLKKGDIEFEMKYYKDIINAEKYSHVIIAGTSLQDDSFIDNIDYFSWLKSYNGKVLGICAGMQVLGLMFGGIINEGEEIGYYFEEFNLDFFGLNGKQEVYHLHNNCIYNSGLQFVLPADAR